MSRYRTYGELDDAPTGDRDVMLLGVDERKDPRLVQASGASAAVNKDFRFGVADTRLGMKTVGMGQQYGVDFPIDFLGGSTTAATTTDAFREQYTDGDDVVRFVVTGAADFSVVDVTRRFTTTGFTDPDLNADWQVLELISTTELYAREPARDPLAPASEVGVGGVVFEFHGSFDFRPIGFRDVLGKGVFSDPFGVEGAMLAIKYGVYILRDHADPILIGLPLNVRLSGRVRLVQAFDRVLLFRGEGEDEETLEWNPQLDFTDLYGAFVAISQTPQRNQDPDNLGYGDGTVIIPNAKDATLFNNRLFLPLGRDEVLVSDILDYTRYNRVSQRFRINEGSDDNIIKIVPWGTTSLIVFKTQSVHLLQNVFGDLADIRGSIISHAYGLTGIDAWVSVGRDIWFFTEAGVFPVSLTTQNELQLGADPITGPLERFMGRINWNFADGIVMDYFENKVYLAAPVDGSNHNNAIAVFDAINKAWAGEWTHDEMDVRGFVRTCHNGRRRLFAVNGNQNPTPDAQGAFFRMNTGFTDEFYGNELQISDSILLRGYAGGRVQRGRYHQMVLELTIWDPRYTITILPDGPGEGYVIANQQTKSRTKQTAWAKPPFDPTNVNDDHGDPYREDYSVNLGPGESISAGTKGIGVNTHQRWHISKRLQARGGFIQVLVENDRGRCGVHGLELEITSGRRGHGDKT